MRNPFPFAEGIKSRDLQKVYRILVPHVRNFRSRFVLAYLALFVAMVMNLLKPWPLKIILDHIILDKAMPDRLVFVYSMTGQDKATLLTISCAAMIAIFFLESLFTFLRKYFMESAGERAINDVRQEVFGHLQVSEFRMGRPADLVVRLTSDIDSMKLLLYAQIPSRTDKRGASGTPAFP